MDYLDVGYIVRNKHFKPVRRGLKSVSEAKEVIKRIQPRYSHKLVMYGRLF